MPTADEILLGLTRIVRENQGIAVLWHVAIAAALVGLLIRRRPSRRAATVLMSLPFLSVAIFAWRYDDAFNAVVFVFLAATLAGLGAGLSPVPVRRGSDWARGFGFAMIAFGGFYPHFLDPATPLVYLVAAPVGLIPCPTLAVVVGFALLGRLRTRAWTAVLAGAALCYGVFGVVRLGVVLDVGLIAGGLALAVMTVQARRPAFNDRAASQGS